MKLVPLGRTGIKVSELCFGTMSFGGDADETAAAALYGACRDAGINFFDCADVYSDGAAEEILGRQIAHERDELVITSKVWGQTGTDINSGGTNRRHVTRAIDASLSRLGTDRLDVYFVHRFDDETPLEETLRGLEDVVRAGKVLYLGASNYAAWQVAKALGISAKEGWARFDVLQPMYNLVKRQAETEILPLAQSENLGVISYSPVGGGLLSGKYRPGVKPDGSRLTENAMYAARYGEEWTYVTAERFTMFAEKMGVHPVSLAVAWVGGHDGITAPIIGARHTEQLKPSLQSIDIDMGEELRSEISALSRTPPPATDRLEDQ
ncbi:aldo/keto reductase [Roseibium polysiphoniae]|uniref:Aldo/keto reductase n=1 Tax=Roseibium polysiphoniae TaxID=2571221 RepID=A0A944CB07_9HYPH|nr:aldo/keto reductase [Roseibium polysiphoniae]MBS8258933.1 aldo/keto reductase [Roseibium polysiphoniae]